MKGHVRRRGNHWCAVYDLPADPVTGRRRQRWESGFRTKREADAALTEILSSLGKGTFVEPLKQTVAAFLDDWLAATSSTRRSSTNATYESVIRTHLVPGIGSIRLQALSSASLNRLYCDLLDAGSSAGTVRYVHAVLRRALKDAVRWSLVSRNVADAADPPSLALARQQTATWTAHEVRTFLAHVRDDQFYAAYRLAVTTGMRRGEICGLHWSDVDLANARISVRRARVVVNSMVVESDVKTNASRRSIALDSETVAALRALYEQVPTTESVFATMHPDALSDAFQRHVRRAGLPRIRFHDLRHTHATLALSAGIHPKVVQERLGHSSIQVTLDRYSHAIPALQETAAQLVADLVSS